MTLSVPQIKKFLKEKVPLLFKIDMKDLKRRGSCISELVEIEEPEDYEQAYHELLQFVRELVHFCRLEFYNVEPHNVPGLKNLFSPGRKKKAKSEPGITGKVKTVEEEVELSEEEIELVNSMPTTEEEVEVAEWGMMPNRTALVPKPKAISSTDYTEETMACDSCGFMGSFKIVSGFPVCPTCGYNPNA